MSIYVDIEKKLGDFHLKVAFETENETQALLGASGCGKSMTLKCIAGIEKPDKGKIILDGVTLFDSEKNQSSATGPACWSNVSKLCPVSKYDCTPEYLCRCKTRKKPR